MYTIGHDRVKNRVSVSFDTLPYGEEMERYSKDLLGAIESCSNGFTILFDMTKTKAKVVSDNDISGLKAAKEYCVKKGLKKVAFAMESNTLKMQISRFLKDTEPKDGFFETAAEANKFLDD